MYAYFPVVNAYDASRVESVLPDFWTASQPAIQGSFHILSSLIGWENGRRAENKHLWVGRHQ